MLAALSEYQRFFVTQRSDLDQLVIINGPESLPLLASISCMTAVARSYECA